MATKKANREQFESQTIPIDDNWQIVRADEYNWEIQRLIEGKWQFQGYYGNLLHAFTALPARLLGEAAKTSLSLIHGSQKAINERIERAANLAKWV